MTMSVNATFSVRLLFCFFRLHFFTYLFIYLFIFFELQYELTKEDRIRKEITPQLLVKKGKRMGL